MIRSDALLREVCGSASVQCRLKAPPSAFKKMVQVWCGAVRSVKYGPRSNSTTQVFRSAYVLLGRSVDST